MAHKTLHRTRLLDHLLPPKEVLHIERPPLRDHQTRRAENDQSRLRYFTRQKSPFKRKSKLSQCRTCCGRQSMHENISMNDINVHLFARPSQVAVMFA